MNIRGIYIPLCALIDESKYMEYNVGLLFFAINLIFIVTNLCGWVLKRFYMPKAYEADFVTLFPAQRLVAALYFMQIFELPYMFHIGSADALFYVNAFSILFFSSIMFIMAEGYFFLRYFTKQYLMLYFLPVTLVLLPLLMQAFGVISLPQGYKTWMFWVVTALFTYYFYLNIRITIKIRQAIHRLDIAEYSSEEDFPVRFAKRIQWLPIFICVTMYACFVADNAWVKFARDILFIVVNVWFSMYTLNPWRTAFSSEELEILNENGEDKPVSRSHMSAERYAELSTRIKELMEKEEGFKNSHLTLEQLMIDMKIETNRSYVSETIGQLGYKSFYDMINQYRLEYAIQYIRSHPEEQLKKVALECGFGTQYAMNKVFRNYKKSTPSSFKK